MSWQQHMDSVNPGAISLTRAAHLACWLTEFNDILIRYKELAVMDSEAEELQEGLSHWRDCHCHATVTVLPIVTLLSCYCHLLSSTAAIVILVNLYQPFLPAVTISK